MHVTRVVLLACRGHELSQSLSHTVTEHSVPRGDCRPADEPPATSQVMSLLDKDEQPDNLASNFVRNLVPVDCRLSPE